MRAGEILSLAVQAGIAPGVSVLDLCCGVAGPGRFITSQLGCTYLGLDSSASAVELARQRAADLPCRFEVARVPPVPPGPFDVVLLLETLLAFPDTEPLLRGIAAALTIGGRFACTVEEGPPLTAAERAAMPDAETVWLVPLPDLLAGLERVGLQPSWVQECSASHQEMVDALIDAFVAERAAITARIGQRGWTSCWRPTSCGVTGCGPVACASSPSSRTKPNFDAARPEHRPGLLLEGGQEPVPEGIHS